MEKRKASGKKKGVVLVSDEKGQPSAGANSPTYLMDIEDEPCDLCGKNINEHLGYWKYCYKNEAGNPAFRHEKPKPANPAQEKEEELGHDATCPMTGKPHNFVCEVCGRYIRNQVEAANKTDSDKWYNAGWDDCKQNMEIENQQAAEKAMEQYDVHLAKELRAMWKEQYHKLECGSPMDNECHCDTAVASEEKLLEEIKKAHARWPGAKGKVET